ncbi:PREDICTED: claudin-4-like [Poecilia mexicana]|uniref:claudin-4-like n=1 Tax=Poecilia mexicana TaxID=48701 RepID=UPI00072E374E|nr:PREDICTED: claudin-4-like [Poecilia mexicana]
MLFQTVSTLFKDTRDRRTCRTRERMVSKTVQTVCVVLGAIGLFGVIICCALPEWFVIHRGDTEVHVGLWKVCVKPSTGPQVCGTYESTLNVSPPHSTRALTVISCMLGVLSLVVLFFGSDFTTYVQNDTKPKLIRAAGGGLLAAGMLVIIPVIREISGGVGLTKGASIYIGILAGLMLIVTGGVLSYLARSSSSGGITNCFGNRA